MGYSHAYRGKGATGFVGNIVIEGEERQFIITCHHVIPDEPTAKRSLFRFNHIDDQYDTNKISGRDLFDITANKWLWTNEVSTPVKMDSEYYV